MKQKNLVIILVSLAVLGAVLYILWAYNANFFMKIRGREAYEAVADID